MLKRVLSLLTGINIEEGRERKEEKKEEEKEEIVEKLTIPTPEEFIFEHKNEWVIDLINKDDATDYYNMSYKFVNEYGYPEVLVPEILVPKDPIVRIVLEHFLGKVTNVIPLRQKVTVPVILPPEETYYVKNLKERIMKIKRSWARRSEGGI